MLCEETLKCFQFEPGDFGVNLAKFMALHEIGEDDRRLICGWMQMSIQHGKVHEGYMARIQAMKPSMFVEGWEPKTIGFEFWKSQLRRAAKAFDKKYQDEMMEWAGYGGIFDQMFGEGPYSENDVDMVNSPPHYQAAGMEVIDVIEAFDMDRNSHLANVVKYVLRHEHKGGKQDLEKALWYLQRAIKRYDHIQGTAAF